MQLFELSIGVIRVFVITGTILHIRVGHSRIRRAVTAHSWISIWPLVQSTGIVLCSSIVSCSISQIGVNFLFTLCASRGGGTLVLDDFLKYIMEDGLRIVGVVNLWADTQYVTTLFDVVFNIIISALISELSHFDFLICKLLIKIVKI